LADACVPHFTRKGREMLPRQDREPGTVLAAHWIGATSAGIGDAVGPGVAGLGRLR
jgi:hypothetical protein